MKKAAIILATAVTLFVSAPILAQEPVSTIIDIRNDLIFPEKGGDQTAQSLKIWLQYGRISGFLESDFKNENHALTIKPSLLFKQGPWYFLGGLSTNSQGSDFVQAGLWHVSRFGQFSVLLDLRNYWSVSGKGNSYTDNLLRVMYPIAGKLSIGGELSYDHWWNERDRNWFFIGPRVSYQLTKEMSVYVRVSREWDAIGSRTESTDRIRTAVQFNF